MIIIIVKKISRNWKIFFPRPETFGYNEANHKFIIFINFRNFTFLREFSIIDNAAP